MPGRCPDLAVEVRTEGAVPPAAADGATRLLRRLAEDSGRPVRYAGVVLSTDAAWPGRLRHQVEATLETVGLRVRGFAAGATFAEALDELEPLLHHRLDQARVRQRIRAGHRGAS